MVQFFQDIVGYVKRSFARSGLREAALPPAGLDADAARKQTWSVVRKYVVPRDAHGG